MASTTAAPPQPPLRGELPVTAAMEVLQQGYLHAVAAAAGCTLAAPFPDRGTDWTLTHASAQHLGDPEVDLKIALKATAQVLARPPGDDFGFTLKADHFAKLSVPDPIVTRLLVVMILPKEMRHWIYSSSDFLQVRHGCYWANLSGHPAGGATSTTVRIRRDHEFDDIALCRIMRQIGQGGIRDDLRSG